MMKKSLGILVFSAVALAQAGAYATIMLVRRARRAEDGG